MNFGVIVTLCLYLIISRNCEVFACNSSKENDISEETDSSEETSEFWMVYINQGILLIILRSNQP